MTQWNCILEKPLWTALFVILLFFPLHAHSRDLYFENNEVVITGGSNHVVLDNTPEDTLYTGKIFCDLGEMESLPETTTLNVNLMRAGAIIKQDQISFSAARWTQVDSTSTWYIWLKTVVGFPTPQFYDYHFVMPIPGSSGNQLRTDSYSFNFTLVSSSTDHVPGNNTYITPTFDYTVYSGILSVNGEIQQISSLTPDTSSMCSGDRFFSAISGGWSTSWWDEHFFTDTLCADISANSDGYSTDVTISRDVSISMPFQVTGDRWVIKGQSPKQLSLRYIHFECAGSPPKTLTLTTRLFSSTIKPLNEIGNFSELLTPNWLSNPNTHLYYFDYEPSFQLPDDGPTLDDVQSGSHSFVSTISVEADGDSSNNTDSLDFEYSVYSGLLYFNEVETSFTDLTFTPNLTCTDGSTVYPRITGVTGNWQELTETTFLNSDFCATESTNPDDYSSDLHVFAGNVYLGNGSASINGFDVDLNNLSLDKDGGTFLSAALVLPEDITVHGIHISTGSIEPRGESVISFSGSQSFSTSLESVTLSTEGLLLHSYGLPFYIANSTLSFSLDGNSDLIAVTPAPVYVHAESQAALAPTDPRTSFPANDIIFHNSDPSGNNAISVSQNGINGQISFEHSSNFVLQTSFPHAQVNFDTWQLNLLNGQIDVSTLYNFMFAMEFGRGCHGVLCNDSADSRWYQVSAQQAVLTATGAFGAQFTDIGPALDQNLQAIGEETVEWGDFPASGNGPGTFVRADRNTQGAFVIPGFIMDHTSDTETDPDRIGQILLGSYLFNSSQEMGVFSPLHDEGNTNATRGDGMFAGINLGPEQYSTLTGGVGQLLHGNTLVRFYDAHITKPQVTMPDSDAVKYVLRPGGLTGVFNTAFDSAVNGSVNIYDYDLTFDRFSFRQDRNKLDGNTFIDGSLTLSQGPVAEGTDNTQQDFDVAFINLDLSCDGNLGAGQIDAEPEPDWPLCSGVGLHKGCQDLIYWNMPVLLTGMTFDYVQDPMETGGCATENRQLFLHTRNQIDGLGTPLTMAGFYSPRGVLHDQQLFGDVKTWFDRSPSDESGSGFGIRLRRAYLNEMEVDGSNDAILPPWQGFTVVAGFTDVPLFDDIRLAGHFDNVSLDDRATYELNIFQDETDTDLNVDGIPDNYANDTVINLRERLTSDEHEAPKPHFNYTWPTTDMVRLNYFATYQKATADQSPLFNGMKESSDLMGVLSVNSVPDYIRPQKTRISFGISADVAGLQNFQLDLANYSSDGALDDFLHSLGVPSDFSLQTILCYTDEHGDELCLNNLEESMLDLTGGDLNAVLGKAVDSAMQVDEGQPLTGLPFAIQQAADKMNSIHQAYGQISSLTMEPLLDIQAEVNTVLTTDFLEDLASLYNDDYLAAIAVYGNVLPTVVSELPPPSGDLASMQLQVDAVRNKLDRILSTLDTGIAAFGEGLAALTDPATGVITQLQQAAVDASATLTSLSDEINNQAFSDLLTSPSPDANILLNEIETARQEVEKVRNAIEHVDLGELGNNLLLAARAGGATIDTSLLDDARQSINSYLDELDESISQANQVINTTYTSLDQNFSQMISGISQLFDSVSPLKLNLTAIYDELDTIRTRLELLTTIDQLTTIRGQFAILRDKLNGENPTYYDFDNWGVAQLAAQNLLDIEGRSFATALRGSEQSLAATVPPNFELDSLSFPEIIVSGSFNLKLFFSASLGDLLDGSEPGTIAGILGSLEDLSSSGLPQPSTEDIRNLIRNSILKSDAVEKLNTVFFTQFGLLSDQLDDISTQMTDRINGLIRETIAGINEALADQLSAATTPIGGWENTIQSVGINGFARISHNEFERIHLQSQIVLEGFPDPTSYNAALDVKAFLDDNGAAGCGDDQGGNFYNVEISTHDVNADMLGMDVTIKDALLGFTINSSAIPVGIFGHCYLDGEIGFQQMVLEDLGLEIGIGEFQTYAGATAGGHFEEFSIPKAAFYLGKSCPDERLGVLGRLDPDVGKFIGPEISPLFGVYLRGSAEIPVWDNGCALTIGAGADLGAWYFTEPGHGTLGGLVGGSLYGELGCLASLKGKIQCLGQLSGSRLLFDGSGWVGAGVGDCSPGSWQSISGVRHDKWCDTADASFGISYDGAFDIYDYQYNCCD